MDFGWSEGHYSAQMIPAQSRDHKRTLVYVPIVHTSADMGTLEASIRSKKLSVLGRQGLTRSVGAVEKLWEKIEGLATESLLTHGVWRVYQDGLPVCGHEREIVSELAEGGSRNHRLLLNLQVRGATLMGTESPELLVAEYQLATTAFADGAILLNDRRQEQLRETLLEKRDRFIAERVNQTLKDGECGILFLGMHHRAAKYLDSDIEVVYPLGQP
jgi:hypothetical protein